MGNEKANRGSANREATRTQKVAHATCMLCACGLAACGITGALAGAACAAGTAIIALCAALSWWVHLSSALGLSAEDAGRKRAALRACAWETAAYAGSLLGMWLFGYVAALYWGHADIWVPIVGFLVTLRFVWRSPQAAARDAARGL